MKKNKQKQNKCQNNMRKKNVNQIKDNKKRKKK